MIISDKTVWSKETYRKLCEQNPCGMTQKQIDEAVQKYEPQTACEMIRGWELSSEYQLSQMFMNSQTPFEKRRG